MIEQLVLDTSLTGIVLYMLYDLRARVARLEVCLNGKEDQA